MKPLRYIILIIAGALIIIISIGMPIQPHFNLSESGWLDIENPNHLNVLFSGQSIVFSSSISKNISEICYAEFTPYSNTFEMEFKDGRCYDLDTNTHDDCSNESDIIIKNKAIRIIGEHRFIKRGNGSIESPFLCSEEILTHIRLKNNFSKNANPETYYKFLDKLPMLGCVRTPQNTFKILFLNNKILYKKENYPNTWKCNDSNQPIIINHEDVPYGYNYFAFMDGNGEYYRIYSFYNTNSSYSIIYNPNRYNFVFPRNEAIPQYNRSLYDHIIIKTESLNTVRTWYRCDNDPWQSSVSDTEYSETIIKNSLCNGDGLHTIYYMSEQNGINETVKEYYFFKDTQRPYVKNVSLGFDEQNHLSITGDYYSPNSLPSISFVEWYMNNELYAITPSGHKPDLSFRNGDIVSAVYYPTDLFGLSGNPAQSNTITIDMSPVVIIIDDYYITRAMESYNISMCERIDDTKKANLCRDGVKTGSHECKDRKTREKFFCLAFLSGNPEYCNYIDLDWYRTSCLVFISGNPEDCLELGDDERDSCIIDFASSTGDQGLCDSISDNDTKTLCIAVAKRDPEECSSITDYGLREICETDASYI